MPFISQVSPYDVRMQARTIFALLGVCAFFVGFVINDVAVGSAHLAGRALPVEKRSQLAQADYPLDYSDTEPYYAEDNEAVVTPEYTDWSNSTYAEASYYSPTVETYDYYDEGYTDYYPTYVTPWYVNAFPGIGVMAQYIIPGQAPPVRIMPLVAPSNQKPAQPSCWISAQPTIVNQGGASELMWNSFNASRATLTDFGAVPISGTRRVAVEGQKTYTLSVSGPGGSNICFTRVDISAPSLPLSCFISTYPSAISRGAEASLAWGSVNAAVATLGGVGAVPLQGGISVNPLLSTDYTLTVSRGGMQKSCTAHLNVN